MFSLDKELVRLVEERKAREQEAMKNNNEGNQIQVKPIIETVIEKPAATPPPPSSSATVPVTTKTMKNDTIDDLLR